MDSNKKQNICSPTVGEIECIPDPFNNSPVVPSVVSFLDPHHQYVRIDKEDVSELDPHPTHVVVGHAAKARIDSHPHHTVYHAKRALGAAFNDPAVTELRNEVEFELIENNTDVAFRVPFHKDYKDGRKTDSVSMPPHRVGSYVVHHLMKMASDYLGHGNVKSAVIAVPAKFNQAQIEATAQAFKDAGVKVARILEEPVAAALAYGLQKKENVDYILVYDFGGGTLDVSMLQVFDGGYVEVMGNDGDNHLGGADFDATVAHSLLEINDGVGGRVVERVSEALKSIEFNLTEEGEMGEEDIEEMLSTQCQRLEETPLCTISSFHTIGEKMKISLSSKSDDSVTGTCLGLASSSEEVPKSISEFCSRLEPISLSLSLEQYNTACAPLFERSLRPIRRLLEALDLHADEIDEVVMVGGTTQMPQVRTMVQAELGVEELNTSIDPDITVAYGAASVID
jgi:molecular chaperone DnaK (HSP70)